MASVLDDIRAKARSALAAWNLPEHEPELLKFRENAVFKVRLADGGKAALRLHRPDYHSREALRSELLWMDDLRRNGLDVPRPIPAADGALLVGLEGRGTQFADLIGWVEGRQLGEAGKPLEHSSAEIARIFRLAGISMAEMHAIADRWVPDSGFIRGAWDAEGLLGDEPLWGRFWDCPGISGEDRAFFSDVRNGLRRRLEAIGAELDYGLIHADLVRENVLVDGERVAFIDFDDCGYGFRLFDIATALLRNRRELHYPLIQSSLLEGYRSKRALPEAELAHLPLFLLLRSLTYIGWAGARPELPDAAERIQRYIREARELAESLNQSA